MENLDYNRLATLIANKIKLREVMSIEEASDYLGIGRDLLTNLAKSKEIKSKDFGTERKSRYRFRREWLDDYMES